MPGVRAGVGPSASPPLRISLTPDPSHLIPAFTEPPHRAPPAVLHPRRADQRAELHQRLVVGPRRAAGARERRLRDRPDRLLVARALGVESWREDAGEPTLPIQAEMFQADDLLICYKWKVEFDLYQLFCAPLE